MPPSPSGCSSLRFLPATKPSNDIEMSSLSLATAPPTGRHPGQRRSVETRRQAHSDDHRANSPSIKDPLVCGCSSTTALGSGVLSCRLLTRDLLVTYTLHMDAVFRALADPTRRSLLDALYKADGQTLSALERRVRMTRFGVMKHLNVLEQAGLVTTKRRGR